MASGNLGERRNFCPPDGTQSGIHCWFGGGPFHALNASIPRNSKKTIKGICPQMPLVFLVPIFAKGKTIHSAFWVLVHIHCLLLFMGFVFPFLGTQNQEKIER